MPKIDIDIPDDFFESADERETFFDGVQESVARHMSCKNAKGKFIEFDPVKHVDLIPRPYDAVTARPTAVLLATITTYALPDRMANINERVQAVADDIGRMVPDTRVPKSMDAVSVTFLVKGEGCWAVNQTA